jgi:hypothetical protein
MIFGRLPRHRLQQHGLALLLLAPVIACMAISGTCDAIAGAWDLAQLMQQRAQVTQARAHFTEQRNSDLFERPLILSGTLRYDSPARVEKQIDRPFKERYVVDGDALRIERDGKRPRTVSLREHPALWAFVESFRATLAGNRSTLQRFYEISLEGDREHWRLLLRPRNEQMRELVDSIKIEGSNADITAIEILEVGGDSSRLTIGPAPS